MEHNPSNLFSLDGNLRYALNANFMATPARQSLIASLFFIGGICLSTPNVFSQIIGIPGMRVRPAADFERTQGTAYRVNGKVIAIDRLGKTFTISIKSGSKTISVAWYSVLIKAGAAASFSRIGIGDEADGIAAMAFSRFTALSVRFGSFRKDLPYGVPVPGQPGYVISPYSPHAGYVDVTGMPAGIEAKDPYSEKIFLVPRQASPRPTAR
jgi:hypothetical protein